MCVCVFHIRMLLVFLKEVLIPEVVSDAAALTSGRGASSSCREKQKKGWNSKNPELMVSGQNYAGCVSFHLVLTCA